jgi:hypothetical protein
MGISDKDYGDALIKQKAFIAQQMREKQMLTTSTITTGAGTSSIILNPVIEQPYGHFKVLSEADLAHDGMKAPLSVLVDMWVVKWSDKWVGESEFKEDDFWRIAFIRLSGANKLEKHHLANQFESVYRIIE